MKRLFIFLLSSFALCFFMVSCAEVVENIIGGYEDTFLIEKISSKGTLFGIKRFGKVTVPIEYKAWGYGIDPRGNFYFSNDNGESFYLYDINGQEILTGKYCTERNFKPVPIKKHHIMTDADKYYGMIFIDGDYYRFDITDGSKYGLFHTEYGHRSYGPFKEFVPGCGGYMYLDLETGKWGMVASQVRFSYGRRTIPIDPCSISEPKYDEVMEVVRELGYDRREYFWFARSGETWTSFNSLGEVIPVDEALLGEALKMNIQPQMTSDGLKVYDQRVGVEGASVAFL